MAIINRCYNNFSALYINNNNHNRHFRDKIMLSAAVGLQYVGSALNNEELHVVHTRFVIAIVFNVCSRKSCCGMTYFAVSKLRLQN